MPSVAIFPFLLPFLLVCAGGLACIGLEAFLNRATKHALLPWIGAAFLVAAGIAQALVGAPGQLGGILAMDTARSWLSLAILGSAMLGLCGLQQSLHRDQYPGGEPYALTLLASAGAMLMVMAIDTITLFLGLELASLCVYALVGLRRHRKESNEALFKYFVMGAVFSAIFLYGAALTYGATGSTQLGAGVLAGRQQLFLLGQAMICIGLLFKVGAVPFHFWSPDAYAGAPAAVTGFMGAVIKVGGFAALGAVWLNQVAVVSGQGGGVLALTDAVSVSVQAQRDLGRFNLVFLIVALLSLVLGNFSALRQNSARRMIAFSSIAHAGYMLLAFVLPSGTGQLQLTSLWFYLVGYAITTAGALAALAALSGREDAGDDLAGLAGQGRGQPFYGLVLTVFLVSIAGVPPTVGFLGKYLVFSELVGKSWTAIAVFAMVMAVVGAAYYFRLIIAVWSGARVEDRRTGVPVLSSWTLAAAALVTVALIAAPGLMARRPAMPSAVATK